MFPSADYHRIGKDIPGTLCVATVASVGPGAVIPIRCKRWSCPVCAPINAFREAVRVAHGMRILQEQGHHFSFVTLTQPASVKTRKGAYAILSNQFDKFRNRWQYRARKQHEQVLYAAFVEGQPKRDGMPHFHIIGTALPDQRTVKAWAVASGFGHQAHVAELKTKSGVAWYVSKYSAKGSEAELMPRGFRRVRYSQGWPPLAWRMDEPSGTAIVRRLDESVLSWAHRSARAFGGLQIDYAESAARLLDSSIQRDTRLDAAVLDVVTALG